MPLPTALTSAQHPTSDDAVKARANVHSAQHSVTPQIHGTQPAPSAAISDAAESLRRPQSSERDITRTINNTRAIIANLYPRLEAYRQNRSRWEAGDQNVPRPLTLPSGERLHPADALDPCPVVNENLSSLVGDICLQAADQPLADGVLGALDPRELNSCRDLSMLAEESLEKSALSLLFAIHKNDQASKGYQAEIDNAAQALLRQEPDLTPALARFKALIVSHPLARLAEQPDLPGQAFIYFDNYTHIVDAELQLLTHALPHKDGEALFRAEDLSQQRFAFVGAGFPLSAIVLQLKTGAHITPVDRDAQAIDNAKGLLKVCAALNIVDKNRFSIVHADALNCAFVSPNTSADTLASLNRDHVVPVTVLDLASALPPEVTRVVINSGTSEDIPIRKRNIGGLSKMLYQPYVHDASRSNYEAAAQVVPPSYPDNETQHPLTVGLTSADNVNSCLLLLPKQAQSTNNI